MNCGNDLYMICLVWGGGTGRREEVLNKIAALFTDHDLTRGLEQTVLKTITGRVELDQ